MKGQTIWQMTEAGFPKVSFVIFRGKAEIRLVARLRCNPFVAASESFPLQYV